MGNHNRDVSDCQGGARLAPWAKKAAEAAEAAEDAADQEADHTEDPAQQPSVA